jgi:phosphatidylglycerophosphate synthase
LGGARSAIVLATTPGAETVVAGLPLAVRAVLALRQAGWGIAVFAPGRPSWLAETLTQRGVTVRWIESRADVTPRLGVEQASVLFLAGDVLVDETAVAALADRVPGPVSTAAGHVVGEIAVAADAEAVLCRAESWPRGGTPAAARALLVPGTRIETGLAVALGAAGSGRQLERILLEHLGGRTADSYLATLVDRRLSRPVTRLLLRTPLAPSHITLLSMAIGLIGAVGLMTGSYWQRLGAVVLLVVSLVLDCVDGEVARARLAQSAAGARLDVIGDYVVNLAVFAGLTVGLLRGGLPPGGAWAAVALLTGVGAAMAVIHALFISPALRRGGDLHWAGDAASLRGRPGASVVEKLASRDYTYLLLVLAAIGHLEWFLYTAAAGAWLFLAIVVGYALLVGQGRRREAAAR